MNLINVFVDMDGVLAKYHPRTVELMYDKGFFLNRPPIKRNLELLNALIEDKRYNVFILTSLLASNAYIKDEKANWLQRYCPHLNKENIFMVPEGVAKNDYILEKGVTGKSILIDDYTVNLIKWENSGNISIKMLNTVNNSNGTWLSKNKPYIKHNQPLSVKMKIIKEIAGI